jgi:redox-sensing transcriptional repressor
MNMDKWGENLSDKKVSKTVIKRLPRYYRYLSELIKDGVERISSSELSDKMQVTASQIRQDLNNFGGFGQQGYGYNVKYLQCKIGAILGLNQEKNMIIIGAGNLGKALSNYSGFEKHGFKTLALFDIDESKVDTKRPIPIYSMDKLDDFLKENTVNIAAITVPKDYAADTAKVIVDLGIKGIWNFAQVDLDPLLPDDVVVQNVHLIESLMELSYNLEH